MLRRLPTTAALLVLCFVLLLGDVQTADAAVRPASAAAQAKQCLSSTAATSRAQRARKVARTPKARKAAARKLLQARAAQAKTCRTGAAPTAAAVAAPAAAAAAQVGSLVGTGAATAQATVSTAAPASTTSAATPAPAPGTTAPTTTTPVPSPAPVPAGSGLRFGINAYTQFAGDGIDAKLDELDAMGAKVAREEINWGEVQRSRTSWDWSRYDNLYAAAARHGITVLPLLMDTPSWAGATWATMPTDAADYARFSGEAVRRYGPNGTFWAAHPELPKVPSTWWEVWNEPYEATFSPPKPNPGAYVRLTRAAVAAGRAADPDARFLLEATFKSATGDDVTWVDAMYAADPQLNDTFDGVAIHPYGLDATAASGQWRRTLESTRADFVRHGAADKPFWLTEMGASTCPGHNPDCTTEAGQAALLAQELTLLQTTYASYVRAVLVYISQDGADQQADDSQDWYGLSRPDGSHKPAWDVFRLAAATGV